MLWPIPARVRKRQISRPHPPAPAHHTDRPGAEHETGNLATGSPQLGLARGDHPLAVGPDDEGAGRFPPGDDLAGVVMGNPLGENMDGGNPGLDRLEGSVAHEARRDEEDGNVRLHLAKGGLRCTEDGNAAHRLPPLSGRDPGHDVRPVIAHSGEEAARLRAGDPLDENAGRSVEDDAHARSFPSPRR